MGMMDYYITDEMRTKVDKKLLKSQVIFLREFLNIGRKKAFENVLGKKQSGINNDLITAEWEFVHYKDAGNNWRNESALYCECGRKLRYQYTLASKVTGLQKSFGLNHLTEHTGIRPEFARLIVKELARLEREQKEMVTKWTAGWTLETVGINCLPPRKKIPEDILWHLSNSMPLLEQQTKRLRQLVHEKNRLAEEIRLQEIVAAEKRQLEEQGHL